MRSADRFRIIHIFKQLLDMYAVCWVWGLFCINAITIPDLHVYCDLLVQHAGRKGSRQSLLSMCN